MSRVFLYLFRFAVIVLGFFAAALAASAFLHLLYLGAAGQGAQALAFEGMEPLALSVPLVALILANFAFLPALPVILIAELTGRRDWLFHALGGAVVTVLAVALSWSMDLSAWREFGEGAPTTDSVLRDPQFVLLLLGAGMTGGIAYWLIAGRSAGLWRLSAVATTPGQSES